MLVEKTQGGTCYKLAGDVKVQPVVVLVHGVGLNKEMWDDWIPILSRSFAVVTYDLLGHGGSENLPGERSARVFCDQLQDLVHNLGIEKFSLVGFSIGAVIAQAFVALYQDRLHHVVFLHGVYRRTDAQCSAVRERYAITRDQGPMATVELAIKRWYSPEFIEANSGRMNQLREIFSNHTHDGYLKAYKFFCYAEDEMRQFDMTKVTIPSLVLTGGAEVGSTPAMSEALAADLPNSTLIINPGHLHMAPDEHSDLLAGQVLSFLLENS